MSQRMVDVFIPGGFPTITYISRTEKQLEKRVASAKDNLSKLVVVTGATKSGKTVLVDKVFPQDKSIWIDGGVVSDEKSFWELIAEHEDLYTEKNCIDQGAKSANFSAEGTVEGGFFVAKGSAAIKGELGTENITGTSITRSVSAKVVAINRLQITKIPLIVDDFHYIEKSIQKSIVRALKSPIMRGLPVIFIAIPNRKYDAVEVEREMTGRIENIEMPVWEDSELKRIAELGFQSLNVGISNSIIETMTMESYGSPFLMQQFCREICNKCSIIERKGLRQVISNNFQIENVFQEIAEHSGRSMFNKIKKGPRARSDRKKRKLKNGTETDIYGVVLEGLKALKPGVESMSYESLRNNIRDILDDVAPQKNEISRVLDQIARISHTDTSSTPVIDWQREDDQITITDPFFAFFLKWSC